MKTKPRTYQYTERDEERKIPKSVNIPLKLLNDALVDIIRKYKPRFGTQKMNLKSLCDRVYSDKIRFTKSIDWICKCITCWKSYRWDDTQQWGIQNGHYKSRAWLKYRFDDDNCRPQCWACNCAKNGNYPVYREVIERKFGEERERRVFFDKEVVSIPAWKYVEMIIDYYWYLPTK